MKEESKMFMLEQENAHLKEDNEVLLNIIIQMKVTLDRLVSRYMTGERAS